MTLKEAMKIVEKQLEGKQDPDTVEYIKQWDETESLKGWWVQCRWEQKGIITNVINFDITNGYIRFLGDLKNIPDYKKGVHQE